MNSRQERVEGEVARSSANVEESGVRRQLSVSLLSDFPRWSWYVSVITLRLPVSMKMQWQVIFLEP